MSEIKRVLVLGSGAREHALAVALAERDREVFVAPGNAGTSEEFRRLVNLLDVRDLVRLADELAPDLVVVGPEAPLCLGAADALSVAGHLTFGPSQAAARLEASKAFLKQLASEANIPTAGYTIVRSFAAAEQEISERGAPIVVKADGLCAGKGVVVAQTEEEALAAARSMLVEGVFGDAGKTVILEDRLDGREVSVHALTDGERYVLLPPARDHKRLLDGDRGPNTGGMGVVCPATDVSPELLDRIAHEIVEPTLAAMRRRGTPFRGVLFAGVMVAPSGDPYLLEHNVRFGDPECEALMPLLDCDLAEVLADVARGRLDPDRLRVHPDRHATVVVLASEGYPEAPRKGALIAGLEQASRVARGSVLHAGTEHLGQGVRVNGGRVLAVRGVGESPMEARATAYEAASAITFEGKQFRNDIGLTASD